LIKEEWLLKDNVEIYNRNYEHIRFGKKYEKELKKIINKRKDRLYISVLDYFSDGEIKEIIDDIKFYLKYKFIIHFEIFIETSIKGLLSNVNFSKRLINDNNYRSKVEKFLQIADVGIKRIDIEEILDEETNEHQRYKIKTIHDIFNDENEVIGEEAFDLKMESTGTIRYFSFIQNMLDMMEKGGVFIVDELTARLHPILTKFIIDLYQNEKNNKAQLIFTTHDISLLNRQQFRRDEIAFVDKNKKGESTVFTLADIKVRSDASFSKDYLFGKYGAIPVINEQDMTEEILEEWIWGD
jgi:predicted ATPase